MVEGIVIIDITNALFIFFQSIVESEANDIRAA